MMNETTTGLPQLDQQLQNFKDIAEEQQNKRLSRWLYRFPLTVSFALFMTQLFNTSVLFSYSRDFTILHNFLASYMNETEALSRSNDNKENDYYVRNGINEEYFDVVRQYMEQLWTLFVSEVIELLIPLFNIIVFLWIFITKKKLHSKLLMIYIMAPVLALLLSISQACMIQISLADQVHHVRFILGKVISPLLEHNPNGSEPIEHFFRCQFLDDGQIKAPSCVSILHDGVMSSTTLNVFIFLHLVPFVVSIYVLLRNLGKRETEHIFLYVENIDGAKSAVDGQSFHSTDSSTEHSGTLRRSNSCTVPHVSVKNSQLINVQQRKVSDRNE